LPGARFWRSEREVLEAIEVSTYGEARWHFVKTEGDSLAQGRARWPTFLVGFALLATLAWGAALCWLLLGLLFP
jgi:hypothetical protein